MIRFSLLIPLLLLLTTHPTHAQKSYIKGYVITATGDSLNGLIADYDWTINPEEISFKTAENAAPQKLKAFQLKAFRTESSYYESKYVKIEKNDIQTSAMPVIEQDTFLLETLVKGTHSLYYLKEKDDKIHFFIGNDATVEELVFRKVQVINNGAKYLSSLELYKDQLATRLNDCPTVQAKIKNTRYTKNAMLNLFRQYYTCTGKGEGYTRKKLKVNAEFGITAGVSLNKLVFNSEIALFNPVTRANLSAIGIPVGPTLELILPKNKQLWSINLEALYSAFKPKDGDINFNLAYIRSNVIVRRYLSTSSIKPFLNAGLSYSVATKAEGLIYNGSSSQFNELNKSGFGVLAGAGIRKGRASAELRYERSAGISTVVTLQSYFNTAYALLTYRLIK